MIPVNRPLLDGNEKRYLIEALESGWISSEGPFVQRFEREFAARVGRQYGIAVCNGTAALDLAVASLDLHPGDEIIVPTFTIIACLHQIVRSGLKPILVDCDPDTFNLRLDDVRARLTPRTKAVMAVHLYGLPVDMLGLLNIAREYGLRVVEDAAEMHGQTCDGRPCGSFGDVSTFSFYPNKHVTTGEGGMITTDRPEIAERCRSLRNLCFQPDRRYVHEELGWNYRMTNLQAALGLAQLERLDEFVTRKRDMGRQYNRLLAGLDALQLPVERTPQAENIYWVYPVVLRDHVPFDAAEAMRRLAEHGIQTRAFFWPMHEQPVFRRLGLFAGERYPVAERLARRGFYIPCGLGITPEEQSFVASALCTIFSS